MLIVQLAMEHLEYLSGTQAPLLLLADSTCDRNAQVLDSCPNECLTCVDAPNS